VEPKPAIAHPGEHFENAGFGRKAACVRIPTMSPGYSEIMSLAVPT
jgi:hypothetical protein